MTYSPTALLLFGALVITGCAPGQAELFMGFSLHATVEFEMPPPRAPRPAVDLQSETVVEFFGVPLDDAQDVVFVLDVSGSMSLPATGRIATLAGDKNKPVVSGVGTASTSPQTTWGQQPPPGVAPPLPAPPTKIEVARGELIAALERLPSQTRMNVIFFSNDLLAFAPAMVPLQEANRTEWIEFVSEARSGGGTALVPALRAAFMLNPRRVVLLSDGLGNRGGNDADALRDAREAMRSGLRIDTIGLGDRQNRALLTLLAQESGGLYQAL